MRAAAAHADATGMRFISSGDEPDLIAGVGTAALEVLESQAPDIEIAIVPVGAGSGACGWLTVRDGLGHTAEGASNQRTRPRPASRGAPANRSVVRT